MLIWNNELPRSCRGWDELCKMLWENNRRILFAIAFRCGYAWYWVQDPLCWRIGTLLEIEWNFNGRFFFVFLKVFFCFSAWGSFPCYLLHFGAKNMCFACILELESPICVPTWLLAFGFTWLHLASLGFAWLMAHGFWLLAFGLGFGRSLHLALGVCWVLVL